MAAHRVVGATALVRRGGVPVESAFTVRAHVDLRERLGILDLPRATKLSGPRFVVLRDRGAKLERALARYFLDLLRRHGPSANDF